MTVRVIHGDCLAEIPKLVAEGVVVDSVCCDPPYHLLPTVKRLAPSTIGGSQVVEQKAAARKDAIGRLAGGFMGQKWDGGDIAFRPETWATVATILRPGAFLVAFGGTRTYHRLACAIEDGGFVIQDCIMWLFATGFPKRRDMLKPAYEPIVLAYKPGGKRTMQIDECRIVTGDTVNPVGSFAQQSAMSPGWSRPWMDDRADLAGRKSAAIERTNTLGRWPANICHDGSDEVLAAFVAAGERSSNDTGAVNRSNPAATRNLYKSGLGPHEWSGRGDTGSAARFFFSASQITPCALCGWPCDGENVINRVCAPVSNAANNSPPPDTTKPFGSAQNDALDSSRPEGEGSHPASQCHATSAANSSLPPHPITPASAPLHAETWPLSKIVQNVRSAAHLCGSCATAIAQSLAASRLGLDPALPPLPASISETSRHILTQSLALYVAGRASTDTILTTPSLSELFGSVLHAIAENISSERSVERVNIGSGQRRFHFSSKAQKSDRWGSRHPTVKPVELMKWLVALVTPPGGMVLDPFAGSGTTGVAALATGRNAILIEREDAYVADIRERMAHYDGGGRHSLASKGRQANPRGETPLFDRPYDETVLGDAQ